MLETYEGPPGILFMFGCGRGGWYGGFLAGPLYGIELGLNDPGGGGTYPAAALALALIASISASVFVDLGMGMSILRGTGGRGFSFGSFGSADFGNASVGGIPLTSGLCAEFTGMNGDLVAFELGVV
jgi:hypothetical protein